MKWAYFGSHGKDLVLDQGTAPGSAYHHVHKQELESEGGVRPVRSDNCVVGCGKDGRCGPPSTPLFFRRDQTRIATE